MQCARSLPRSRLARGVGAPRHRSAVLPLAAARGGRHAPQHVTFVVPLKGGGEETTKFSRLPQRDFTNFLLLYGATGVIVNPTTGEISADVQDLADNASYRVVVAGQPSFAEQVKNLQEFSNNQVKANEAQLGRALKASAADRFPNAVVEELLRKPYKDRDGQDFVQIDAGVVVLREGGGLLMLAEFKQVVTLGGLTDAVVKLDKVRQVLADTSLVPQLAQALHGVTEVELYFGGNMCSSKISEAEMVAHCSALKVSFAMPSADGFTFLTPPVAQKI